MKNGSARWSKIFVVLKCHLVFYLAVLQTPRGVFPAEAVARDFLLTRVQLMHKADKGAQPVVQALAADAPGFK